jgi:hypothetical protein
MQTEKTPTAAQIAQAKQIQSNELLRALLAEFAEGQIMAWRASNDTAKREQCWHLVRALDTLRVFIYDRADRLAKLAD